MRAKDLRLSVLRPLVAVAAALVLLSCELAPAQTTRPVSVTPGLDGRIIEDVLILGNIQVPTSVIRNVIRSQKGDKYDPATVQRDYQRMFELKKFKSVEAKVEPTTSGGVNVVFEVAEQSLIKKITWHGNVRVATSDLQSATDIKVGQAFDSFRVALAKQAIVDTYREKNFPFAHVDVPIDPLTERGELIYNVVEGPQVRIRKINFIGAVRIGPDDLQKQIKTATWFPIFSAGKFDPEMVEEDMGALRAYYRDRGFFDVRVGRKLVFSPDQSELQIDFVIDEGPRYVVNRISFAGNSKLSDAQLRAGLNLRPGMFYDEDTAKRDVKQIVTDYSPFGFIYADLRQLQTGEHLDDYLTIAPQRIYHPPDRAELLYHIHEGKPFRVGRILVKGNDKSQEKLVLREFRDFQPGQIYNAGAVEDATERLRALPFFKTVTVTPIGDDPQFRDLLVEVSENRTAMFNIGAGVSSSGGITGTLVFSQQNFDITNVPADWRDALSDKAFAGAGQGLRVSFSPGTIYTSADVQFSEPWLFDQPYKFLNDAYYRSAVREAYFDQRLGDQITFGKYFDYQDQGSVSLRGERVSIISIQDPRFRAPEILEGRGSHLLTDVGLQFQRDTTNPGPLPFRDYILTAGAESIGALGGDYHFGRFAFGYSGYQTVYQDLLDRRTILNLRFNVGSIVGRSVFFERFYGGDIGSVRGFRFRGISPRSGRGEDPVGGDFYFTTTAELTFPIYQNVFRGVIFADAGDVENDVRFGVIRAAVGPGVRFSLPIFNQTSIALYFGIPLVRGHGDETQFISFSLSPFQ